MKRSDDFDSRRKELAALSDEQLKDRFWALAQRLTDPLLQMGQEYTSPSIERSVLLRMGLSSQEAAALVKGCLEQELLGHGAGHVLLKMSRLWETDIRAAALRLLQGQDWEAARAAFKGGQRA